MAEQAHYLGHLDAAKGAFSVKENLQFWAGVHRDRADRRGALAPDRRSLGGRAEPIDFPAAYLSAGQKRRLSLARLVAVEAADLAAR